MVANLCMEAIEEVAINPSEVQPKVWKRYVDDSFCIIKRNSVNSFHTTVNSIDSHISFTVEEESDQQIAFSERDLNEIQVINKPLKTLQQEFPSPKFRPSTEHQPNVVYKIPCADCGWCYIGETGRCFETRKKEHIRNVKTCANGSNIAKHAWSFDHRMDFDNSSVVDKGSFRIRKTLEAWHTSATEHADNNSKPIPNQYCIPFKK